MEYDKSKEKDCGESVFTKITACFDVNSQPTITCSKLTIETFEQHVKYVHYAIGVVLLS